MTDPTDHPVRPAELLDGIGADAFAAFNAMQTTKQRHYALLAQLDEKKRRYGLAPSARESARLADLLADHDAQVRRFTLAAAALKRQDGTGHRALFAYIGQLADVPAEGEGDVRH